VHKPLDSDNQREGPDSAPLALRDQEANVLSGELLTPGETMMAGGAAEAAPPRRPTIASVLRFKWTILALFVVIAAPAITAVWLLVKPKYSATAAVRVRPRIPHLVFRTEDNGMIPLYRSFMNTQVSLIRSPMVLQRALDSSEVQATRWYADPPKPLLGQVESPLERLQDALTVSPRRNTEVIGLSFTAGSAKEAELILKSVLDKYMDYVRDTSDESTREINKQLTQQYNQLKNEIQGRETTISRLRQRLGTQTPEELVSRQRVRLDEASAALETLRREVDVLDLQLSQLREYDQDSYIQEKEAQRLQFVSRIRNMPPKARSQLRSQLEEHRKWLSSQIDDAKKLRAQRDRAKAAIDPRVAAHQEKVAPVANKVAELKRKLAETGGGAGKGASPRPSASTAADSPDARKLAAKERELKTLRQPLDKALAEQAKAVERVKEAETRLKLLNLQLTGVQDQLADLDKVIAESHAEEEEAAKSQPAETHRYDEDPEWRRLSIALKMAQHNMEMGTKRFTDSHPQMVELVGNVDLARQLLEARQKQLDALWKDLAAASLRRGTTDGAGMRTRPVAQPTGTPGVLGVPLVATVPLDQHIKLVEQQRNLKQHELDLLKNDVEHLKKQSSETFEEAALLDKETRELAHRRAMFEAVRQRLEAKQMEANVPGSIGVLSPAIGRSTPSRDRRVVFTLMALVLALGAGAGAAFLRANTTQAMHAAEELPRPLQAPFLGNLPLVRRAKEAFETNPVMVENIRMVRTALLSRMKEAKGSKVMISSADTGAGKSTVAVMLGRSLAECGKNVLLIDADLRRSSLTTHFGLDDEPGLMDSLARRDDRLQTVFPTNTPRLSVMPTGTAQDIAEIELIANGAFTAFVERLGKEYDIILLDSSPILPVADARILSRQVDGTVLVIREEKSRRSDVVEALACLGTAGGKLLGTVFIGNVRNERYGYDNYYYYRGGKKA